MTNHDDPRDPAALSEAGYLLGWCVVVAVCLLAVWLAGRMG